LSGTDERCHSPAAQQKIDGIDDDGFAGTGLSAQNGQTTIKGYPKVVDDGKVANGKLLKHKGFIAQHALFVKMLFYRDALISEQTHLTSMQRSDGVFLLETE
jgi:hypothetical protein